MLIIGVVGRDNQLQQRITALIIEQSPETVRVFDFRSLSSLGAVEVKRLLDEMFCPKDGRNVISLLLNVDSPDYAQWCRDLGGVLFHVGRPSMTVPNKAGGHDFIVCVDEAKDGAFSVEEAVQAGRNVMMKFGKAKRSIKDIQTLIHSRDSFKERKGFGRGEKYIQQAMGNKKYRI